MDQEEIIAAILKELRRAEKLHHHWPDDIIHASAIVAEESGELTRACLNMVYGDEPLFQVRKEAIQTGAMVIRFLMHT